MKCEYCGTEYEIKNDVPIIRIESFQNPVREYSACVFVDDDAINNYGEVCMEHAIKKLCEEMLPAVMYGMKIKTERDLKMNKTRVDGSLRIVMPKIG